MKKNKQTLILLAGLLLASSLALSSCNPQKNPPAETDGDTTVADTSVTEPSTNDTTEETTEGATEEVTTPETETTPSVDTSPVETDPTETETDDPSASAEITSDEAKTLLQASLEADKLHAAGTVTVRTIINGELLSVNTILQKGEDFIFVSNSMGSSESLVVTGDTAYYSYAYDTGEYLDESAYRVALTPEQKQELYTLYVGEEDEDDALFEALLAGTWSGERLPDGSVNLSSSELDESLTALLLGEEMEGAVPSFDFTLSPEGLMTFMRFTVTLPAEMAGGMEYSISSESTADYDVPTVEAPADASAYVEATYDEVFYGIPTIDPDMAATVGLPLDGNNYVLGGEDSTYDAETQFRFLNEYGFYYVDKTFVLYGHFSEDEWGDFYVAVDDSIAYWVIIPDGMEIPADGAYVKMTTVFDAYGMVAEAIEIMDEPAEATESTPMYVTAVALNVRSAPDSLEEDNKIGMLYNGNQVEVLETGFGEDGLWCKIAFDCDAGYAFVKITYLSETMPETTA